MERNIPKKTFGDLFPLLLVLIIIDFGLILFEVYLPAVMYVCAIAFGSVLAYLDNKRNATKDVVLYIVYIISSIIAVIIFHYCVGAMAGKGVALPRIVFAVVFILSLTPGYLLIKIYNKRVNNKLEDAYWEEYDKQNANK